VVIDGRRIGGEMRALVRDLRATVGIALESTERVPAALGEETRRGSFDAGAGAIP
jgi:hypothetical protein